MRDFVYVDDVVDVNLWFFDHPQKSGLFNLGSGRAQPFNDVAISVINAEKAHQKGSAHTDLQLTEAVEQGLIEYIDFPQALVGKYQCYTQADLAALRAAGCDHKFKSVQEGVRAYIQTLNTATE